MGNQMEAQAREDEEAAEKDDTIKKESRFSLSDLYGGAAAIGAAWSVRTLENARHHITYASTLTDEQRRIGRPEKLRAQIIEHADFRAHLRQEHLNTLLGEVYTPKNCVLFMPHLG